MPSMIIPASQIQVGDAVTIHGVYCGKVVEVRSFARKHARLDKYTTLHQQGDPDAGREDTLPYGVRMRKGCKEESGTHAECPAYVLLVFNRQPLVSRSVGLDTSVEVFRRATAA